MTPGSPHPNPGEPRPIAWPWALVVGVVATCWLGFDLPSEPRFIDESAYLSQTYFADLLLDGEWNDPAWLEYGAIDLPPLPKYLFGSALRVAGHRRFGREMARGWYARPASFVVGSKDDLEIARWMVVPLGAMGCISVFAIGTIVADRRVGALAAFFLMINPLYAIHSRRAMADVPCEAFVLASAAFALHGWKSALSGSKGWRNLIISGSAIGILGGLAVLSKLSGGLAMMNLAGQTLLGIALPAFSMRSKGLLCLRALIAAGLAFLTFLVLNPMLWAQPRTRLPPGSEAIAGKPIVGRTIDVIRFRADVSQVALHKPAFRKDALRTPIEKLAAVAVQGFGRFGPLGPRILDSSLRFDPVRDRGAWIWGPMVVCGVVWSIRLGWTQAKRREPPTAWALFTQFVITMTTVTAFIPLAWDRYMLPIQAVSALLASGIFVAGVDRLIAHFLRRQGAS